MFVATVCQKLNIAKHKPTTTSSLYGSMPSSSATDGSWVTTSDYCTHSQMNANEWLAIDLEVMSNICKIKLLNRAVVGKFYKCGNKAQRSNKPKQ